MHRIKIRIVSEKEKNEGDPNDYCLIEDARVGELSMKELHAMSEGKQEVRITWKAAIPMFKMMGKNDN